MTAIGLGLFVLGWLTAVCSAKPNAWETLTNSWRFRDYPWFTSGMTMAVVGALFVTAGVIRRVWELMP